MFRYWDGRSWSASTTSNPYVGPPATAPAPVSGPPAGGAQGSGRSSGGPSGSGPSGSGPSGSGGPGRRSPVGWILAGVGALVVGALVVTGVLLLRNLDVAPPDQDPEMNPSNSAAIQCPATPSQTPTPIPDTGSDRVVSGHLSYPRLAPPFSTPEPDSRTPFGRDVRSQVAPVEKSADGTSSWVAGVLIARLLAGDGFYGPQQGAAVVAQCIVGKFYGDNPVDRKDLRNQATTIDGHPGWIIEMHLTFDIPGIQAKGETATIVVVDTGSADGEAGLFYSSIPDNAPQFSEPAAVALKDLQVS